MFGFKKKENKEKESKREELLSVVDGFAVASTGDTIYACADATVTMLFPSNHAVGLTLPNGMEILIHVGIDTVNENGNGFTCMCEQGKTVKKGEALLKMDREYLLSKGYDLTVIVIFTNAESYKEFRKVDNVDMKGGESIAVTYTV